jgi:hypothetical protein
MNLSATISSILLALTALPPPQAEAPLLIGRIEQAYAQPSSTGRVIATLEVFNGRLYVGYGDYTADSGPIAVVAVDLETGTIGEPLLSHTSEAIYIYRQVAGQLFAPDIDPRGTRMAGFARGVAGVDADRWTDEKVVRALHLFDVASFDGSDLWLFGSLGSDAVAWRSRDGGSIWSTILSAAPRTDDGFARFYCGFALGGRLYTQVTDYPGGVRSRSMVFDGTGWSTGPTLIPTFVSHADVFPWKPLRVGDQVVYMDDHSGTTMVPARLYRFDGQRAELTFGPSDRHQTGDLQDFVLDVTVSEDTAYVLNRLQQIWSSTDLVNWTLRTTFSGVEDDSATSLAVAGDDLYLGTRLSRIYKVPLPPVGTRPRRWP